MSDVAAPSKAVRMRRILSMARPYRGRLSLGTVFLFIGSGGTLLYPQLVQRIVDAVTEDTDQALVGTWGLWLALIFVGVGCSVAMRYYLFTWVGESIVADLRRMLYDRLLHLEIAFFDRERVGNLMSRLGADTTAIQNAASINISMALRALVQCIGAFVLLFMTSPRLTGVMALSVPPLAIGAAIAARRLRKFSRQVQDSLADASGHAEEGLAAIRVLRSFGREAYHTALYDHHIGETLQATKRRITWMALFQGTMVTTGYLAILNVMRVGFGMVMSGSGELTLGTLVSFLLYTLTVAMSISTLAGLWGNYQTALGAAERVFEILDVDPPRQGGQVPAQFEGSIAVRNLHFAYPSRPDVEVLKGLSLDMPKGSLVAVVGRSGSGKSTLASLLLGLYDTYRGEITFDGLSLRELDTGWLRNQIGVVSQEPTLFSTSIEENIRYGAPVGTEAPAEQAVVEAARQAYAHDFISAFPEGYQTKVGERGVQLSGGQKQRVAIARAILRDPKILIFDEATSALDAESEHLVQEALRSLIKNRTTIVIAHRLSTVRNADQVVVLEEGAIAEAGTHDALMGKEGIYKELVKYQLVAS